VGNIFCSKPPLDLLLDLLDGKSRFFGPAGYSNLSKLTISNQTIANHCFFILSKVEIGEPGKQLQFQTMENKKDLVV